MSHPYASRLLTLRQQLHVGEMAVIASLTDVLYLTGFRCITLNEREAFLILTSEEAVLCATAFTPLPPHLESPEQRPPALRIVRSASLERVLPGILSPISVQTLLLDEEHLVVRELRQIEKIVGGKSESEKVRISAFDRMKIWTQRMIKDAAEQQKLAKAGSTIAQALRDTLAQLQVGQSERQVAEFLDARLRTLGATGPSFPTIVAFGPHSALPHHQPGDTRLTDETVVLIDAGALIDDYCSDMTRTIWFGEHPNLEFMKVQSIVADAYQAGIRCLTKNSSTPTNQQSEHSPTRHTALDLDDAVRTVITSAGYGPQYIHTSGHGIGLDVHEPPSLYRTTALPLSSGMAITLEPGIYLDGRFGVRFENTLLLHDQEVTVLTDDEDDKIAPLATTVA